MHARLANPARLSLSLFALVASLVALSTTAQAGELDVRGLRADDGNGVEITSAALGKLDDGPPTGALSYSLYVSKATNVPFERVPGASDFVLRAKAAVDPNITEGNRRLAKDKVLLIDPAPLRWREGMPWPEPRRYRVGEKKVVDGVASLDEQLSAPTEFRPTIVYGIDPEMDRIELDNLPQDGWFDLNFSLSLADQHYDVAGATFTVRTGKWLGFGWSSRLEGKRVFMNPGPFFSPTGNGAVVRVPAALGPVTVDVEAEGEGFVLRRSFTVVPAERAVAERKETAALFARSHQNSLAALRQEAASLGPWLAETRVRIAKETDSAMTEVIKKLREDVENVQLDFATVQLTIADNDPRTESVAAERGFEWSRFLNAAERERALHVQIGTMQQQRWAKNPERARFVAEQHRGQMLDLERRRADAAEHAGNPGAFREACDAQLQLLAGGGDLEKQGRALETMAHGIAHLSNDRAGAADTLKRARAALLQAAPEEERKLLAISHEEDPLPAWWPATAQAPSVTKVAVDPYWEWEADFLKRARKRMTIVDGAKIKVGHLSVAMAALRGRQLRMSAALAEETATHQYSDAMRERVKSQIARDRELESSVLPVEIARIKKEAVDVYGTLGDEIEKARVKWGIAHPNLFQWREQAQEMERRLPLEIACAVADAGELHSLLHSAASWHNVSPETYRWLRFMEQKEAILNGEPLKALFILRDLHNSDPSHPGVRRLLTEVEASCLKAGLFKTHGAIASARANFDTYVGERGFGKGEQDTSWLGKKYKLRDYDSERAWVIWSTGFIGALSGALDRPGDEEIKLQRKETPLQNAYLGLQVMVWLSLQGCTLAEIRRMDPQTILDTLPARTTLGKPWDLGDAAVFRRQIDAALELEDVRKLVDDERDGLARALEREYWNPNEASSTWLEWVGDLTSPRNLLMLWLPMLKVEVTGGKMMSGTRALARAIGLEGATAWAASPWGERVASILRTSAEYRGDSFAWSAGQFVAYLGLQASAGCLAKKYAGQYGQIASEALFSLASDPAMVGKWITEGKAKREAVEQVLDTAQKALGERLTNLRQLESARSELVTLLREMEANPTMTLDPVMDAKLKGFLGADWLKTTHQFPSGDSDDLIAALVQAISDARRRANSGVRKALEAGQETIDAELAATIGRQDALKSLRSQLSNANPVTPHKLDAFLEQAVLPYLDKFGPRAPWVIKEGSRVAEAFGLLRAAKNKEQFLEAGKAFRSLSKEIELSQATADLPAPILQWYAEMADELASLPARPASALDEELTNFIEPARIDKAVELAQTATWTKRPLSETTIVEAAGESFLVKRMTASEKRPVESLVRAAEGEALGWGFSRALGVTAPAIGIRPRLAGDTLELYVVTRFVKGAEEVASLKPGRIYQLAEELSFHRGIALMLGDYDRKLANYLVTKEGVLCAIDGASADIRGLVPLLDYGVPINHPEFMEGAWGIGHWLRRCRNVFEMQGEGLKGEMRATLLAELALTADPAREAVRRGKNLIQNKDYVKNVLLMVHGHPPDASPELLRAYKKLHEDMGSNFDNFDLDRIVEKVVSGIDARIGTSEQALNSLRTRTGQP